MLTEKYENMVKTIKLISGEELISYVTKKDGEYYLTKPLMAVLGVNPENPMQGQVSFCPWLICGTQNLINIHLENSKILLVADPDVNAANQYVLSVGDAK